MSTIFKMSIILYRSISIDILLLILIKLIVIIIIKRLFVLYISSCLRNTGLHILMPY
jgi:hypothetical protein